MVLMVLRCYGIVRVVLGYSGDDGGCAGGDCGDDGDDDDDDDGGRQRHPHSN